MWDTYNEDRAPRASIVRLVRIVVFGAIGVIIFGIVGNQSVNLLMNVEEFGAVFTKPLYYSILSGLILASIAVVRVNFSARHSVLWHGITTLLNFLKRGDYESQIRVFRYSEFHMGKTGFALWQLTKVVLLAPLFGNIMFGMATEYVLQGNDLDLGSIGNIFAIPFADVPMDGSYAQQNVMPMLPALTLLVPPLLAAVGLRLLMYVGISGTVNVVSDYAVDSKEGKTRFLSYISTIEIIAGVSVFWIGFNMFFSSTIDYNTRYAIAGAITLGAAFIGFGFLDKRHARVIIYPNRRQMFARLFTAAAVVGLAGLIMIVNSSIADTRQIEWPYIAQHIEVNRHMHGLNQVDVVDYDVAQRSILPASIQTTVEQNADILNNIRLWDEKNAEEKLGEELAQRSDLQYFDFDILRFGGSLYWAGTSVPVMPESVAPENEWFNQHVIYTHSDVGIKMLEANAGVVVDESQFFEQRRIYYGESGDGLFSTYWSAYPVDRMESAELGRFMYNGTGGVDVAPPLSWMFEPNFMVSYSGTPVHIMRYKDINDRMELLYPYFVYEFGFGNMPSNPQLKDVEAFAVADGTDTYWLVPLIVAINTSHVPWSSTATSSFMLQLVGYSLVDAYDGTVQIIVTGDDYFSEMFLEQYDDVGATREVPVWLVDQIRYPEEIFIWRVSKFNTYHVTDPKGYIEAKDFYAVSDDAVSEGLTPHYLFAQPPGFESPKFLGFQSLQLKEPQSDNLVGYMVVQNDLDDLGRMIFYSLPADSPYKFIDAATAQKTLTKDNGYDEARKALSTNANPPLGEGTLYKVGDHEVYFFPAFTSTGGKRVGFVGAVGAASATGTYLVGLGNTPSLAFENYLQKLSGVAPAIQPPTGNHTAVDRQGRVETLEKAFTDAGLIVVRPTAISATLEFEEAQAPYRAETELAQAQAAIRGFIQGFVSDGGRVFEWQEGNAVNFGVLREVDGIVENHYISIEVG